MNGMERAATLVSRYAHGITRTTVAHVAGRHIGAAANDSSCSDCVVCGGTEQPRESRLCEACRSLAEVFKREQQ